MCQWLMAKCYQRLMSDAEDKGLREWRKNLLGNLSGTVLEIGAGTGENLEFYPKNINQLILSEPSSAMREKLKERLSAQPDRNVNTSVDFAEKLNFSNESIDSVVSTLVLCSVKNLEKSLAEIHRVLRQNGKLIFIEHVAAVNNPKRYQWQRRLGFFMEVTVCRLSHYATYRRSNHQIRL